MKKTHKLTRLRNIRTKYSQIKKVGLLLNKQHQILLNILILCQQIKPIIIG